MLAVRDVQSDQFSAARTDDYGKTGLVLLEDLVVANPSVFPSRAVLMTNATDAILQDAERVRSAHSVDLWSKGAFLNPRYFVARVTQWLDDRPRITPTEGTR
jgi:hypothetical protein